MAKTIERQIAEILDDEIRARAYGVTRLSKQIGVVTRTIDRWCADETTPSGADILHIISAVHSMEPERGIRLASRLLGISGLAAHQAPKADVTAGSAHIEACEVVETAAELEREVRERSRDGVLDAADQAVIANVSHRVVRQAVEVPAVARASGTAERSLALGAMA